MKKRVLVIALVSAMMTCMLTACGGNGGSSDSKSAKEDTSLDDLKKIGRASCRERVYVLV